MVTSEPPKKETNQWVTKWGPMALIALALSVWCCVHAIGAFRAEEDPSKGIVKSLIVLACLGLFLGFWGLALAARKRRISLSVDEVSDQDETF